MAPDKTHFDRQYSSKKYQFKFNYDSDILNDILKYKKSGKILDLGCGESGLSLTLAEKGFEVSCVDISQTAIEAIKKEARNRGVKINAIVEDLEDYEIKENFDIIICCGMLHFVEGFRELIKNIKARTFHGGINIIDVFINKWLTGGDFENIYSDWKVLEKDKYEVALKGEKRKMIYLVMKKDK